MGKYKKHLKPAILYKDQIAQKSRELYYTDDSFYYNGYITNDPIIVKEGDDYNERFQYAIVDNNKDLIGYISFHVDFYSKNADSFGLISFDRGNPIIGFAVKEVIDMLIEEFCIHRLEFRCIGGNPVKRHYDWFCRNMNGKCHCLQDVIRDHRRDYHNVYIYEMIIEENE